MKNSKFLLLLLSFFLLSCGAQKRNTFSTAHQEVSAEPFLKSNPVEEEEEASPEIEAEEELPLLSIIEYAKEFLGTSYRYGGTTSEGMDCSGLVYTSFLTEDILLPRSSRDMSLLGEALDIEEVSIGDLLFFQTDRRKKVINHVGLIVEIAKNAVFFIHSTNSRGVIISSMDEKYWREHFVMARRIL